MTHSVGGSYTFQLRRTGLARATIAVSKKGTGVRIGHRAAADRDTDGPTGDPDLLGRSTSPATGDLLGQDFECVGCRDAPAEPGSVAQRPLTQPTSQTWHR